MNKSGNQNADYGAPHIWDSIALCCPLEEWEVSIQIANPGGKAERAEVVERIGGLLGSAYASALSERAPDGTISDTQQKFLEEVKSLFHALIGAYPTAEEMSRMGAQ